MAVNAWQYSKWVFTIGRSFAINPPSVSERTAVESFINFFWDPETQTGTRNWLGVRENKTSVSGLTQYLGDPNVEPDQIDLKMVKIIGRNLKQVTLNDAEAVQCDILFAATGNRRYNLAP